MDPPPEITARGRRAEPERRRAQAQRAHRVLLPGDRHHAGDVHAADRDGLAVPDGHARRRRRSSSMAPATTGSTCPPTSPRAASGRSCSTTARRARCCRPTSRTPSLGSQSGTVEQNPDGSTDLYFGPQAPAGKEPNWIQTVPGKGWFGILRLYSPLQPFFDKTWRPSEIEPVAGESDRGPGP